MKKYFVYSLICISLLSWSLLVQAEGDFDGSKPLLCAAIHAAECGALDHQCKSGPPWVVGFPVFIEMDFDAGTASTTRPEVVDRVSKIEDVGHMDNNRMSVQGTDGEYSWSMLISEETGSMTLAVAGEDVGFIVLGACTIH